MSDHELLGPAELMARFGMARSTFTRKQAEGAFERFKVHPPLGRRCYSKALVDRYLAGEPLERPTFGRRRAG